MRPHDAGRCFQRPEGLVLAADSRITLTTTLSTGQQHVSYFDNATKLLSIEGQPYVGVLTYGLTVIGTVQPRSIYGFIPEFEAELAKENGNKGMAVTRLKVIDVAQKLGEFYAGQWDKAQHQWP